MNITDDLVVQRSLRYNIYQVKRKLFDAQPNGDDTYHDNTLVVVECIYGHTYRVLQRQLNNPRCIQLALFTPDGRRYSDLSPGHIARHGGITLHRENISRVIAPCEQEAQP